LGRNLLFLFVVFFDEGVESLWDVVHDEVQIDLILLKSQIKDIFALREILVPEFDTVGVVDVLDDLVLSVLVALVLEDLLDGHCLFGLTVDCLEIIMGLTWKTSPKVPFPTSWVMM